MPRRASVQITRNPRADQTITYALRVRAASGDDTVPLGNSSDGWDEARADQARRQLLAKIELGLWSPDTVPDSGDSKEEPTFAELATSPIASATPPSVPEPPTATAGD